MNQTETETRISRRSHITDLLLSGDVDGFDRLRPTIHPSLWKQYLEERESGKDQRLAMAITVLPAFFKDRPFWAELILKVGEFYNLLEQPEEHVRHVMDRYDIERKSERFAPHLSLLFANVAAGADILLGMRSPLRGEKESRTPVQHIEGALDQYIISAKLARAAAHAVICNLVSLPPR